MKVKGIVKGKGKGEGKGKSWVRPGSKVKDPKPRIQGQEPRLRTKDKHHGHGTDFMKIIFEKNHLNFGTKN